MMFNKGDLVQYSLIRYADNTYPMGIVIGKDSTIGTVDVKWFPDTVKETVSFHPPKQFGHRTISLSIVAKAQAS